MATHRHWIGPALASCALAACFSDPGGGGDTQGTGDPTEATGAPPPTTETSSTGPSSATKMDSSASSSSSTTDPASTTEPTGTGTDPGTTDATTTTDASTTADPTTTDPSTTDPSTTGQELAPPEVGEPCAFDANDLYCWTEGPGKVGTIYRCEAGVWVINNDLCQAICEDLPPPMGGGVPISPAMSAGCSGNGWLTADAWDCLCFEQDICDFEGCTFNDVAMRDELKFCVGPNAFNALCNECLTDPNDDTKPICGPNPEPVPP